MNLCDQDGYCAAVLVCVEINHEKVPRGHTLCYWPFIFKAPFIVSRRISFRTSFRSTQKQSDDTALDMVILLTLNILIIRIHLLKHTGTGLEVEARPNGEYWTEILLVFLLFFRWRFFRCRGLLLLLLTLFLSRFLFFTLSLLRGLGWFTPWGFINIIFNV